MAFDGAERCCFNDTLHVYTGDWTGQALIKLQKNSAGEWSGALAAQLRAIAAHTLMRLEWLEQEDCQNNLVPPWGGTAELVYYCVRLDNSTVPLARFLNHWRMSHWKLPPEQRGHWTTTSFIESDFAALLPVYYDSSDYGIFQFLAPFSRDLWIALGVAFLVVGTVMPLTLRDPRTYETRVHGGFFFASPSQRGLLLYHSVSELLGNTELEWTTNISSRVLKASLVLLRSDWTASLHSSLPANRLGGSSSSLSPRPPTPPTSLPSSPRRGEPSRARRQCRSCDLRWRVSRSSPTTRAIRRR